MERLWIWPYEIMCPISNWVGVTKGQLGQLSLMENSELLDEFSHTFVVKVWLEEILEESGQAIWRGHITHVMSKKRSYIQTLGDITSFIGPYIKKMGANLDLP